MIFHQNVALFVQVSVVELTPGTKVREDPKPYYAGMYFVPSKGIFCQCPLQPSVPKGTTMCSVQGTCQIYITQGFAYTKGNIIHFLSKLSSFFGLPEEQKRARVGPKI